MQGNTYRLRPNMLLLEPSRVKLYRTCLAALTLWAMVELTSNTSFLAVGLLGIGVLALLLETIPGNTFLRLEEDGMVLRSMLRTTTFPWGEVGDVGVTMMGDKGLVGWNNNARSNPHPWVSCLNRRFGGWDNLLPDTYEIDAHKLADTIRGYRDRHLGIDPDMA